MNFATKQPPPVRFVPAPRLAKHGTFTVLALAGIAATQLALFAIHQRAATWVAHSRTVRNVARDARLNLVDRRAAIDGFVITRDSAFLAGDNLNRAHLRQNIDSLVVLTADNQQQQQRARAIDRAVSDWDSTYAAPALAGKLPGASLKLAGAPLFETVGERFAEFGVGEDALYQQRAARDELISTISLFATVIPIAILAIVLALLHRRIREQTEAITDQQTQLEEQAIELENQVEELETTNAELVEASRETERARDTAERALLDRDRANALLDSALTSSPIGFAFLDTELNYVAVNAQLAKTRNLLPADFVGRLVLDMASTPAAGARALGNLERVINSGKPVLNNEMVGRSRTGEEVRYLITYFPIRNAAADLLGAGMVVTDTTERSRLEEQFRQSQKMEALGRLASGVAHDFRNLLTVIRSYCDLVLLDTPESDPKRPELIEIRGAADRAAILARQLLSFGKPQPLLITELDLNDSFDGVTAMLRHIAPAAIAIEFAPNRELGGVLADPGHVEQVLMNLAINAIDAMPNGGRLRFETANVELDEAYARANSGVVPGAYVMISVSDTGTGMDAATLKRIYEPFFTTKPAGKGTGLGLATVYGIVTQNGGHTWVYSEPGKGTTFKVYFPRIAHPAVEAPSARSAKSQPVRARASETVLVVEDDFAVRGSLARILTKFGYRVLEAEHGVDGIRMAREHDGPIHLAISDLMMPEMSGREFAQKLDEVRPDTHVLFMSGFTDEDVLHRGLVGADQWFIQKPFAIEDITRKVHEVLRAPA